MKYLMNKENFTVHGWSEQAVKWNTHVEITREQMMYVNANPAVNGPKLLLYLVTSAGSAKETIDAGFMELLRKEQALQDAGGEKYIPPVAPAPVAPVAEPVAPEPAKTDGPSPIEQIRDMLAAMEDKAAIMKYSTETLGQKLGIELRWGKDRMIAAICDELAKKA